MNKITRTFLAVQWMGPCASNYRGHSFNLRLGTKITACPVAWWKILQSYNAIEEDDKKSMSLQSLGDVTTLTPILMTETTPIVPFKTFMPAESSEMVLRGTLNPPFSSIAGILIKGSFPFYQHF